MATKLSSTSHDELNSELYDQSLPPSSNCSSRRCSSASSSFYTGLSRTPPLSSGRVTPGRVTPLSRQSDSNYYNSPFSKNAWGTPQKSSTTSKRSDKYGKFCKALAIGGILSIGFMVSLFIPGFNVSFFLGLGLAMLIIITLAYLAVTAVSLIREESRPKLRYPAYLGFQLFPMK